MDVTVEVVVVVDAVRVLVVLVIPKHEQAEA